VDLESDCGGCSAESAIRDIHSRISTALPRPMLEKETVWITTALKTVLQTPEESIIIIYHMVILSSYE
jgi:hypothetical protein